MTRDEQIAEILEEFDWNKVHHAMVALNWTWDACHGIPDVKLMKEFAIRQLKRAWGDAMANSKNIRIHTGGFVAECSAGYLSLWFCLEDWTVDPPEMESISPLVSPRRKAIHGSAVLVPPASGHPPKSFG